MPTTVAAYTTRLGADIAVAIATAMAGPVAFCAKGQRTSVKNSMLKLLPIVFKIVPTSRVAKSPKAMAPSASIKYNFAFFFNFSLKLSFVIIFS